MSYIVVSISNLELGARNNKNLKLVCDHEQSCTIIGFLQAMWAKEQGVPTSHNAYMYTKLLEQKEE